jgi:hypothetical protein
MNYFPNNTLTHYTWIVINNWWWLDNLFSLSYRFYDWFRWKTCGIYSWVSQRRFQTVEIDIRDDTGSIVPFERGRVVVTLHCRKRKEFSLEWNQLIIAIRAFWNKFCPVDFNRASAACLIFLPCTTSPAIFNPVFKASRPRVFAPFYNKGIAALKRPPKIGRIPRTTSYKRTWQVKKRPDVGRLSNGTHRMIFSDKNGTCTPQLMRMHEIRTGFIWSSTYTDQCVTWDVSSVRVQAGRWWNQFFVEANADITKEGMNP